MSNLAPYNTETQFFKYYSVRAAKSVLTDIKLKWSSPLLFNDPFDSQIDLSINPDMELMAQQTFDTFMSSILSDIPTVPYDKTSFIMEMLRITVSKVGINQKDVPSLMEAARTGAQQAVASIPEVNNQVKSLLSDASMFCVTETNDNKLMWAHYADQHRGAVFRFLPTVYDSPLSVAQKVNYVDALPKFEAKDFLDPLTMPAKAFRYFTLTKGKEWSYEKEWRVVSFMRDPSKSFEILPFAREELAGVYLGVKMDEEDQDEIIKLCKKNFPHVEIFKASLDSKDLKIVFQKT